MNSERKRMVGVVLFAAALAALSTPAPAQTYNNQSSHNGQAHNGRDGRYVTPGGKKCAIGETNNGGSISSSAVGDDADREAPDPRSCDDVGQ